MVSASFGERLEVLLVHEEPVVLELEEQVRLRGQLVQVQLRQLLRLAALVVLRWQLPIDRCQWHTRLTEQVTLVLTILLVVSRLPIKVAFPFLARLFTIAVYIQRHQLAEFFLAHRLLAHLISLRTSVTLLIDIILLVELFLLLLICQVVVVQLLDDEVRVVRGVLDRAAAAEHGVVLDFPDVLQHDLLELLVLRRRKHQLLRCLLRVLVVIVQIQVVQIHGQVTAVFLHEAVPFVLDRCLEVPFVVVLGRVLLTQQVDGEQLGLGCLLLLEERLALVRVRTADGVPDFALLVLRRLELTENQLRLALLNALQVVLLRVTPLVLTVEITLIVLRFYIYRIRIILLRCCVIVKDLFIALLFHIGNLAIKRLIFFVIAYSGNGRVEK